MRDQLVDFEVGTSSAVSEEVIMHPWGRALLSPGIPRVWDASRIVIERAGLSAPQVAAAADEGLAGCEHRTATIYNEAEGERLAGEIGGLPGWEVDRTVFMAWDGVSAATPGAAVAEAPLRGCEALRRELIAAEFPPEMEARDETTEQLLAWNDRFGPVAGDRWFLAPADAPAAACCLLSGDGVGQIENVGTLERARGRGLGNAVIIAALAASRAQGDHTTFIVADSEDWPRQMYAKLGFRAVGEQVTLRRAPT